MLLMLQVPVLTPIAKLESKDINEMSGIAASRRFKGVYWVHNDSGDEARFFAIDRMGKSIGRASGFELPGASNLDWEDVAVDGDTIYLADTGNNLNFRKSLTVYAVKEFDPTRPPASLAFKAFELKWPDQTEFPPSGEWRWDCEALAVHKGTMYFVTKWRRGKDNRMPGVGAALYKLGSPRTDRMNVPVRISENLDLGGWVTGCDISPDGRRLAVLTQAPAQSVWIFDMTQKDMLKHPLKQIKFTGAKQCEAVCWDGKDRLLVTNEQRDVYEVSAK